MVSEKKRFLQRMRVPLGFLFAIIFLIFAKPAFSTLMVGGIIAVAGLLIRAWASGHIRKNENLAISGPYAYTRNPLYFGSFLLGVGFTAASGVWWLALIFVVLFLGIYLPVMRVEREDLIEMFADAYREYAEHVPMFVPRPTAWKKSVDKFDFQLYLRYREYRAALGLFFALAVLVLKIIFKDYINW